VEGERALDLHKKFGEVFRMRRRRRVLSDNLSAGVTRYQQLYTVLAQSLSDGDFDLAGPLPSEPELVKRFRVSRTTVRRAFALLEREGRIFRRRGSGTYATRSGARTPLSVAIDNLYDETQTTRGASADVVQWAEMAVPSHLRARYPELGTRVLCVMHLWSAQGDPFQMSTTYVPKAVARKNGLRRPGRSSRTHGLESLRKQVQLAEHIAGASTADAVAAKQLALTLGAPLIRLRSTLRGRDGELRAVEESLFRPDLCQLQVNFERDRAKWKLAR
jgi:GntR family transcriptional regulator